jgi:hypothetical protein
MYVDKRNWKEYEKDLMARKKKIAEFFMREPTNEELIAELEKMNAGKVGHKFEIPETIIIYFHFLKCTARTDDRMLTLQLTSFQNRIMGTDRADFDHSAVVKRREILDLDVPFAITPQSLNGKRLYFDGMCLRVGRGGNYRSKKYGAKVKYLRVGLFSDDGGRTVDFVIGDEHDAEINMIREKKEDILNSGADSFDVDGAGSAQDVVVDLAKAKIKPIIRASKSVVEAHRNAPPPDQCIREKKPEDLIWEKYVKEQEDYQRWRVETGYSSRWVFSEGKISSFKRAFGEEVLCRKQKTIHDEIGVKFMVLDTKLPELWPG